MKNKQSIFSQELARDFKNKKINQLSDSDKKEYRMNMLENFFMEFSNKENRFIFFCPDIVVVNPIVEIIYKTALTVKNLGYSVIILHEIKGFRCKWILEKYKEYSDLTIDYIIDKKSKKSKKENNSYSFKPTDTLIIPDLFQDILENIREVKLLQKVVLVTGNAGIGNLQPGNTYKQLGVNSLLFLEKNTKEKYEKLFPELDNSLLMSSYSIDNELYNSEKIIPNEILPAIAFNKNEKLAQQVTNIFFNKYPNLRFFSIKFLDRQNYELYLESLTRSCLFVYLDEDISFKKPVYEALTLGIPTVTNTRNDFEETDLFSFSKDPFEIADAIAEFCINWLECSNNTMKQSVLSLANSYDLTGKHSDVKFRNEVLQIFETLHQEKIKYFTSLKQSVEKIETTINEQK